ncbi:MAG: glycosyltransferase family 9 protein [Ignavibacteria bacterium]|nr:glycosyltransferase family 9 protein [Ignavibacteria bacterium]
MREIRKILFLAEGQMGDSIVLTPALKAAKDSLPGVSITILLFHRRKYISNDSSGNPYIELTNYSGTAEIFKGNPNVDTVLELDRKAMRSLKGFARLKAEWNCIKYLRKQKYDAVISTFPQNRFVIWSYFAGIKKRIGEKGQQFGFLLTEKPAIKRSDAGVLNYFCGLLKPLGVTAKNKDTYYHTPEDEIVNTRKILDNLNISKDKKLLIIHPGASDKDRQLPPVMMAELINVLNSKNNMEILFAYSEYDEVYIISLQEIYKDKLSLIKTDTISGLAGILKTADAVLVHNSGPRHLAAAIGVKTIGLLEKYDDIMWKIYENEKNHAIVQSQKSCSLCGTGKCGGFIPEGNKFGAKCMHDIDINEIYSSIVRIINNP